jgi:DNA-binding beta-propeller fold protein YncE
LVVVESDYQSSNVSLLGFDGNVLSGSLISSSTQGSGFGTALSSDVVPASSTDPGPRLPLIDRYAPGVLRFIDLATARVASELSVGTGFNANPQDYLVLDVHKAYVARYQVNANPGRQDWDGGGDVLIVDPSLPAISGRIDLLPAMAGEDTQFTPHPARLLQVAGRVFVLLASYANDFLLGGTSSRLVELDPSTDGIVSTLVFDGLRGCDSLAVSPGQTELAVTCTGDDLRDAVAKNDRSGLVLVDISGTPVEKRRFAASSFGDAPVGFAVDYAASSVLLFSSFGHFDESGAIAAQDTLWRLDTADGSHDAVLSSEHTPFTLGAVRCAPACGVCFAADAERGGGSVLRFALDSAAALSAPTLIRADARVGLPPRYLSVF